jgi:hypothetical protein
VQVAPHEFGSAAAASGSIHGHVFRSFGLKHEAKFANLALQVHHDIAGIVIIQDVALGKVVNALCPLLFKVHDFFVGNV